MMSCEIKTEHNDDEEHYNKTWYIFPPSMSEQLDTEIDLKPQPTDLLDTLPQTSPVYSVVHGTPDESVSSVSSDGDASSTRSARSTPDVEHAGAALSPFCAVCGDRSTGKHYGAPCCDGCKGFFRRSIRRPYNYACRFDRDCTVDKNQRNRCRFCRLNKCLKVGMNKDAVQSERDRIAKRCTQPETKTEIEEADEASSHGLSTTSLLSAEILLQTNSLTVENNEIDLTFKRFANVVDICESMRQQLITLVEWSKNIEAFTHLTFDDKVALLRSYASKHLLLTVARRSQHLKDVLLLGNDCIISRYVSDPNSENDLDISNIGAQVMDKMVSGLNKLNIDETEFACLKAILFFNPDASGLSDEQTVQVFCTEVMINLKRYVSKKPNSAGREMNILRSILPALQSISDQMVVQIRVANLCKLAHIDNLIIDLLLGGSAETIPPLPSGIENI